MKQRLLSAFMALVMMLALMPPKAAAFDTSRLEADQTDPNVPVSVDVKYTPVMKGSSTVNGETVPAASVPYAKSLGVEDSKEYSFTADVKNELGEVMADQTVEWSCSAGDGITFTASGNTAKLVIVSSALKGYDNSCGCPVTITAVCGAAESKKTFLIYVPTRKAAYLEILKDGTPIAADSIAPGGSASYTAKVYDQYGVEMDGRAVTDADDGNPAPMTVPAVAWSVDGSTVTVSGGTVMVPDGASGTVTVTASAEGAAAAVAVAIRPKEPHQLTPPENQTLIYGGIKAVSAASSTGATGITYSSDRPDIVTVDGNGVLTAKKVGTATVTVRAPESNGYMEASASFTVTVTAKTLTADMVALDSAQFTYNAQEQMPEVTIDGLTEGSDYTVTSCCGSHPGSACKEAGTHILKIQGVGSCAGEAVMAFTITQAGPAVAALPETVSVKIGGTATFYVSVTGITAPGGTEGERLTDKAVTVSTSDAVICTVGKADVNGNFPVTVTGKARTDAAGVALTVTYPGNTNYHEKTAAVTVIVSDKEPVVKNLAIGGLTDGKAVNGTVLTARHDASASAALTYQWLRDGIAIPGAASAAAYTVTNDDVGHKLSVKVSGSAAYTAVTSDEADAVGISVNVALALAESSIRTGGTTAASVMVTATNGANTGEVTGGAVTFTSSAPSVAAVNAQSGVVTAFSKSGTVNITAKFELDGYVTTTSSAAALTVEEKDALNVTVADVSVAVGGTAAVTPEVKTQDNLTTLNADTDYDVTYSLPADSSVAAITGGILTGQNTGETAVTVTVTPKSTSAYAADYRATEKTFQVTVAARSVTPTVAMATESLVYTGSALMPAVTVTVPASGGTRTLEEGKDYALTYANNTNAGTDTASATVTAVSGSNYTWADPIVKRFSIEKADVAVKADNKEMTAGGALPELTCTITGIAGKEELAAAGVRAACEADGKTAGTYPITVSGPASLANYNITYENGVLSVKAKPSAPQPVPGTPSAPPLPAAPIAPSGSDTPIAAPSVSLKVSISGGTAMAEIPAGAAEQLVEQAADGASAVVIAPEIPAGVSRTEVSISSDAVSAVAAETTAALKIETPAASVTIPHNGLISLSGQGGVVISTGKADGAVSIEIMAAGRPVDAVPGGVRAEIPAACGPGTVAQVVDSNGNVLATVRKSFADGGVMNVPLGGSAKIVFVDNSKRFADVPADGRAADAVAFASSHELMNGAGGGVFGPGEPMTRGMLAVVLHNLEGNPHAAHSGGFGDVSADAWYAAAVHWAADNGIINGVDAGVFSPGVSITREQLAVMLYRYIGQPAAVGSMSRFSDAANVSGWAREAMIWAVSNGIVGSFDGALHPQDSATRAEAAQILMNFVTSGIL